MIELTADFLAGEKIEIGNKNMTAAVIKYCFDAGVDHVLVGARKKEYIHQVKDFL